MEVFSLLDTCPCVNIPQDVNISPLTLQSHTIRLIFVALFTQIQYLLLFLVCQCNMCACTHTHQSHVIFTYKLQLHPIIFVYESVCSIFRESSYIQGDFLLSTYGNTESIQLSLKFHFINTFQHPANQIIVVPAVVFCRSKLIVLRGWGFSTFLILLEVLGFKDRLMDTIAKWLPQVQGQSNHWSVFQWDECISCNLANSQVKGFFKNRKEVCFSDQCICFAVMQA